MLSRPVRHDLRMREVGGGKGVTAEGLHLEVVTSVEEVMDCLKRGQDQRVVAPMAMNARSSRGHGSRGAVIDDTPAPPWQRPGAAPVPSAGRAWRLWAPNYRLECSSEPPPQSSRSLRVHTLWDMAWRKVVASSRLGVRRTLERPPRLRETSLPWSRQAYS